MSSDEIETDAQVMERRKLARKIMPYVLELIKPKIRTEIWKAAASVGAIIFVAILVVSWVQVTNLGTMIDKLSAEVKALPVTPINQTQTINTPAPRTRDDNVHDLLFKTKGPVE